MQNSAASLSVAVVHGDGADCYWAGDSPIYISRQAAQGFESELTFQLDKAAGNVLTDHFGGAAPFKLKHQHLTLAVGDILPTAVFLASNLFDPTLKPVFAEYLLPLTEREKQWQQIYAVGANQ